MWRCRWSILNVVENERLYANWADMPLIPSQLPQGRTERLVTMFTHSSREKHGIRWWCHFRSESRAVIGVEFYWWSLWLGASVSTDDEGWIVSLRLPPFALYLSLEGLGLWQPQRKCIATWDNNREIWLTDRRECEVSFYDWTFRVTPWGRWGEWNKRDPWWIRGVSLDLRRVVLGDRTYIAEELALVPVQVPMPEGNYPAVAKVQRVTRGFRRWFKRTGQEVTLNIPKGIPFAGKGENSYDCDDDGLFGIGGDSIEDAIHRAQEAVHESRRRHGHASAETIREALS
jgi:hypothetical protein